MYRSFFSPSLSASGGSAWSGGGVASMGPSPLPRWSDVEWWSARVAIPEDVVEMSFCFSDGEATYDNNGGADYGISVREVKTAKPPPRSIAGIESHEHAGGTLHLVSLGKREGGSRSARWQVTPPLFHFLFSLSPVPRLSPLLSPSNAKAPARSEHAAHCRPSPIHRL